MLKIALKYDMCNMNEHKQVEVEIDEDFHIFVDEGLRTSLKISSTGKLKHATAVLTTKSQHGSNFVILRIGSNF